MISLPNISALPVSPVSQHSREQSQCCWAAIVYLSPEPEIRKDSVKCIYGLLVTHTHTLTQTGSHTPWSPLIHLATLSTTILLCLPVYFVYISIVTETKGVWSIRNMTAFYTSDVHPHKWRLLLSFLYLSSRLSTRGAPECNHNERKFAQAFLQKCVQSREAFISPTSMFTM